MKPYERFINRLNGKPVDKIPNFCILMQFAAQYCDIPFDRFCLDYQCLVRANIKCCEDFGIDILSTLSDNYRETYDFGASIEFPFNKLPVCKEHFLRDYSDVKKLKLFNPLESIRVYDRIRAVELYKKECGNHYPVLGWVEGALAEYNDLRGINEMMIDVFDAPEFVHECLEILCEEAILCAKEQVKAGADIIGIGDSAASLISPGFFREFALPYEKRIFDAIHGFGATGRLHICGNITHLLEDICETGADIVDVDWMVDFKSANEILNGHACANGNFDPVSVLYNGTTQAIEKEVLKCVKSGNEFTFIMAGCEVAKDTKVENLMAVDKTLKMINGVK